MISKYKYMGQKTIASLLGKKFHRITRAETNEIIHTINNSAIKSDLISKVKHFKYGSEGKDSLKNIAEKISETTHGSLAVDKFVRAVIDKDKKNGLTPEQIKRNLRRTRRERIDEESGVITRGSASKQYAGGQVQSHGIMQHDAKQNMGIKVGNTGFAANYKSNQSMNNSAPKDPSVGTRPLGL
jgi:hypothetical protein